MEPRRRSQRQTRHQQDLRHRRLRIDRIGAQDLRERGRLRRQRPGNLQQPDQHPHGKAQHQPRQRLCRAVAQQRRPVRRQQGDLRPDRRRHHCGEGKAKRQPDPHRHVLRAEGGQQRHRRAGAQEHHPAQPGPVAEQVKQRGGRGGHAATTASTAGLASRPISSKDSTGSCSPRVATTVFRNRRRRVEVTSAGLSAWPAIRA